MSTCTAAIPAVQLFPPRQVRIHDGPFTAALEMNRAFILAHDPARLLAPFRREAGIPTEAQPYGDWESIGLDGHTAGHYISALAYMAALTGEEELRKRLDYMVNALVEVQAANGDGYIGGVPDSRRLWEEVAAGQIRAGGFDLNGRWAPWYNLHKTFAGLRDAWLIAGNQQAREALINLTEWCYRLVENLSDEQVQTMLRSEHGGMNEALADVAVIAGEERFLRLAQRFSHRAILDPLISGEDRLTGLHANTQIPKVVGFQRIGVLTGNESWKSAGRFFWDNVVHRRSVAFGGNSVAEHFNPPDDFRGMLEHRDGPESCNTYNMLRLTKLLFQSSPNAEYADFYERALFNHILSTIHPYDPGFVYLTPIRPGHYRVYSVPEIHFWCCVGTGMENPGRFGDFIYARDDAGLWVNLYTASELSWPERGLTVRQETAFPDEPRSRIVFSLANDQTFNLRLRHPGWVREGEFRVVINGETLDISSQPSSYVSIERMWRDGDRVEVELPMHTWLKQLPDGSPWYAIMRGPIVLASETSRDDLVGLRAPDASWSHIAGGPLAPITSFPSLIASNPEDVVAAIHPVADKPMTFPIDGAILTSGEPVTLIPFFRLHDARYQMYWQVLDAAAYAKQREAAIEAERAALAREAATLARVRPGEQQPEVEHNFRGEDTEAGEWSGRRYRHGRWFSYELRVPAGERNVDLLLTYWGGDSRAFDIFINDRLFVTERLQGLTPGQFIDVRHRIPTEILSQAPGRRLTIRFAAHPSSLAGGIFDVRLMRAE